MPNLDLVPTAEAARMLGCHVRTVHRLVEAGALTPAVQAPGLRGARMFRTRDVMRLAKQRKAA
jgi:excisionase family DNA binding protein